MKDQYRIQQQIQQTGELNNHYYNNVFTGMIMPVHNYSPSTTLDTNSCVNCIPCYSELSKHNQQQRTISVQPSSTHYSSSGSESEGNDIDWEEEREGPSLETSTQELTQYPPNGDPSEADEGIFSRFRSYAGSIRVKLSNKDKKKLEELESEERLIFFQYTI